VQNVKILRNKHSIISWTDTRRQNPEELSGLWIRQ